MPHFISSLKLLCMFIMHLYAITCTIIQFTYFNRIYIVFYETCTQSFQPKIAITNLVFNKINTSRI